MTTACELAKMSQW